MINSVDIAKKQSITLHLFEILTLFVFLNGLSAVALLVLNLFDPLYSLIIGTFLTVFVVKVFQCKVAIKDNRFSLYLLCILLIAFFFSANPAIYVIGGQDQGVYVNMSSSYAEAGSTFITDDVRASLDVEQKQLYDKHNHRSTHFMLDNKYEGVHRLGIYIKDLDKNEYVYQFYPLHPLWMSIFAKVFGSDNRVYSMVFFSLLAIVSFYLLAYELSGQKRPPGYIVALILAVNPLFVFLAKFPVSEMVLVTFSSLGLYYLLRYYNSTKTDEDGTFNLFLSGLAFLNMFFVHISGFFYIPLFYLLLLIAVIFVTNKKVRRRLAMYSLFGIFAYILSLTYGLIYSYPYSHDIYKIQLASRLVKFDWKLELILAVLVMTLFPFLLYRIRHIIINFIKRWRTHIPILISLIILLIIPVNFFMMHKLGVQTGKPADFLLYSTSYGVISYLTFFGLFLFLGGLNYFRKSPNTEHLFLLLFLLYWWLVRVYVPAQTGFNYYGARYLFSEVIPYSLLIVSLYGAYLLQKSGLKRWIATFCIGWLLLYSIYYSAYQLQGQESEGANQALKVIAEELDTSDLLFSTFGDTQIMPSLENYFNLNLFVLPKEHLESREFLAGFLDKFNDIFVISNIPLGYTGLEMVNIIPYKQGTFEHPETKLPTKFYFIKEMELYLYRLHRKQFSITIRPSSYPLTNFYADATWTNGDGTISDLDVPLDPNHKYLILQSGGSNYYRNDLEKLHLQLIVNGKALEFSHQSGNDYYFSINPSAIKEIKEIQINSSTFVPIEVGINSDSRTLGIDVLRFKIE